MTLSSVRALSCVGALSLVAATDGLAQARVGLSGGTEYGFGLLATAGTRQTQVEIAGGLAPVFFAGTVINTAESVLHVYLPAAAGAKLSFAVNQGPLRQAIKVGATYNALIKLGVGAGFDAEINKRAKVGGGVMLYPQAKKKLLARVNEDDGTTFNEGDISAPLANIFPFVGFAYFFR